MCRRGVLNWRWAAIAEKEDVGQAGSTMGWLMVTTTRYRFLLGCQGK